jgi:hypothetical protein
VSLEAEILPPQTADQTRTTLPWEILLENHQQIDACPLVLRNQYPAQSFPRWFSLVSTFCVRVQEHPLLERV